MESNIHAAVNKAAAALAFSVRFRPKWRATNGLVARSGWGMGSVPGQQGTRLSAKHSTKFT
jgi:hypothetical protein